MLAFPKKDNAQRTASELSGLDGRIEYLRENSVADEAGNPFFLDFEFDMADDPANYVLPPEGRFPD